eukprot:scaffold1705_cov304-Prasinococcus_capsulatus_cf.AAC.3
MSCVRPSIRLPAAATPPPARGAEGTRTARSTSPPRVSGLAARPSRCADGSTPAAASLGLAAPPTIGWFTFPVTIFPRVRRARWIPASVDARAAAVQDQRQSPPRRRCCSCCCGCRCVRPVAPGAARRVRAPGALNTHAFVRTPAASFMTRGAWRAGRRAAARPSRSCAPRPAARRRARAACAAPSPACDAPPPPPPVSPRSPHARERARAAACPSSTHRVSWCASRRPTAAPSAAASSSASSSTCAAPSRAIAWAFLRCARRRPASLSRHRRRRILRGPGGSRGAPGGPPPRWGSG